MRKKQHKEHNSDKNRRTNASESVGISLGRVRGELCPGGPALCGYRLVMPPIFKSRIGHGGLSTELQDEKK